MKIAGLALGACLALTLAGCGGGSSSSSSSVATASPTPVPVNFQAAGTTLTYPADSAVLAATAGVGVTGSESDASGAGSTVSITTSASGDLSSVTLSILTPSGTFNHTYTSFSSLTGPTLGTLAATLEAVNTGAVGSTGLIATQTAQAAQLASSAYGIWASSDTATTGRIGVLAIGNATPLGAMPVAGTVTYNGSTIGAAGSATAGFAITGNAQIVANFGTGNVTTTFSGLEMQNIQTNAVSAMSDLTGNSTIAGNHYTGPLAGGGLGGTVNGTFYGTAAQETTGVWRVSGGGVTALGSYGAK